MTSKDHDPRAPYDGPQCETLGIQVPAHWRTREDGPYPSPQTTLRNPPQQPTSTDTGTPETA